MKYSLSGDISHDNLNINENFKLKEIQLQINYKRKSYGSIVHVAPIIIKSRKNKTKLCETNEIFYKVIH